MLNKSIRIRTTPDGTDKYVKVKLDQEFDFIEILSLKITQEEAYRNFCADYGVVVGRVFINNGFGVPNARVSVFIPIDDVDKNDPIISGLYPYEIVTDRDIDGKRYNLLPKYTETDNDCFTPIGSFPNKREVLDDPEMGHVYCKYYKFTTSTNYAGDYMIFGVPTGNYTIHVDADISDIGIASQRPYDNISQGAPVQMFDSPTKFKGGNNLDKLIQVKSSNAGVNVQPFWGSVENCEIGISRIDIDLNYNIIPSAIFMGGIFGDHDKNSVNKNCRPRRKMGKMCEQNTSEGSIEMIRKTMDGDIEKLDIEGGRLIDDKGSWAYQIPMNLDYYYTNEFGELVLSEDPNKGIPTRSSVRFKIAMDDTGGLGRLRTRAKFLVPHNPTTGNPDEIDYEFGKLTKDSSFRDLYWNKIYSVSNFIARYQKPNPFYTAKNRNMIGLKDVDDCPGDKLPIPFNRTNTTFNPLFFVICLIMKIIESIMFIINSVIVFILNLIMIIVNAIIGIVCNIVRLIRRILRFIGLGGRPRAPSWCSKKYWVPCVGAKCPFEESQVYYFAPGCSGKGREALESQGYDVFSVTLFELSNCVAAAMARALNLFQFDFYNDWLNGSLYAFLIKYKKRRRKEKFCKYDCSGSDCKSALLIDTCYTSTDDNDYHSAGIREGMVKKYNNELFYAPTNKNANLKLYATEIINLGAVFNCDWQGVPKIQEYLVPTTYSLPPLLDEFLEENPSQLDTSGQIDIGRNFGGMFFDISCAGLSANKRQALNIRHNCEFGVDIDETDEDENNVLVTANHNLGTFEINSEYGKFVRDVFFGLNNVTNNINVTLPYSTNFNQCNVGDYDFWSTANGTCGLPTNGQDYVDFRGITNGSSFQQPKHSFYFYFGAIPGATGLDKMNNKFFTKCTKKLTLEFFIKIDEVTPITVTGATNGTATFTIVSGTGPFTYTISGPAGFTPLTGTLTQPNVTQLITGLSEGSYIISVTDPAGNAISQTFEIPGPTPLYASAFVSSNCTVLSTPYNGQITLLDVGGGSNTYTATLYNSSNSIVQIGQCTGTTVGLTTNPSSITQVPTTFCGLPLDISPNNDPAHSGHSGYYIVIRDTSTPQQTVTLYDLIVNGISALNVQISTVLPTCFDGSNGIIQINVSGGIDPYIINTVKQNSVDDTENFGGVSANTISTGTYITTVTDSSSPSQTFTSAPIVIKPIEPEMKLIPNLTLLPKQCDPNFYYINVSVPNNLGVNYLGYNYTHVNQYGPVHGFIQYNFDDTQDANENLIWQSPITVNYVNPNPLSTLPPTGPFDMVLQIPKNSLAESIKIRLSNPAGTCGSNYDTDDTNFFIGMMKLPPTFLSGNTIGVDNTKQCEVNYATIRFNISHLVLSATYRAPYAVLYEVMPINTSLPTSTQVYGTQATYSQLIDVNQQPIRLYVPDIVYNSFTYRPNYCKVRIVLVDNVGCTSPPFEIGPIKLPTTALNVTWQSTAIPNSTNCNKQYTITGGIAGTSPTYNILYGPQLTSPTSNTGFSVVPCNFTISVQGEDSVGCPFNRNSP